MRARRAVSVLLAVLTLAGCGGSDLPAPVPTTVEPGRGFAANITPITILGDGFSVRTIQSSSGGAPTVDETFQAWIDDQPLQDVWRVDGQTLSATIPAGLPPGAKALRVQGPFGTSGVLQNAFTVEGSARAAMAAAITAAPATVSVGQAITVTLTVTNGGTSAATAVTPAAPTVTGPGTVGTPTGPDPASIATLAPGASGTFTWTYLATGAGTLAFSGAASATDSFSGATVTSSMDPAHPAQATVVTGTGLVADLTPGRTPALPAGQPFTVNVGQAFTLSLSVTNTGSTGAVGVVPSAIANCTTVSPVSAAIPSGPTPVVFLYSGCTSPTPETLSPSASASGTDANTPTRVVTSNTASASVLVQTPALVTTTGLVASPSTLGAGQAFTVTLALAKTGLAAASMTAAALTGTTCTTPPALPVSAAGATLNLTWSGCTAPATPQTLILGASATWVDANTGAPLTAGPASAAVPVAAATVTATSIVATPATLSAGQTFTITLTLTKALGSSANLTAVSMDFAASCAVAPILPVNNIPATQALVWTGCTAPTAPQLLSVSGFATWVDPSLPLVPQTTSVTSTTVRVLAPAALIVTFAAQPPSPVKVGQVVTLTAHVQNSAPPGGEEATGMIVTASVRSVSGKAAAKCTAATPVSVAIAAGSVVSFGFTCTPTKEGSLTFTATANGRAAASGAALSAAATTAPPTTVLR